MPKGIKFMLINVGFAEHHADWNYKQVVSPFARIYLPTYGSATIHLPSGSYKAEVGYLYIIPAYCMHHYECNSDFSLYYIHLYEGENELSIGENYDFQNKIPASELDKILIKHLADINPGRDLKSYNPQFYNNQSTFLVDVSSSAQEALHHQLETQSILELLISHFLRFAHPKNEKLDDRIAKSLLYIRSNLAHDIDIPQLAAMNCISTEYFTRKFTQLLGQAPVKYIQTKRIQRAQLLLIVNSTPIKDIAYAVGYNDVSYFNRVFRRMVGCTPQEYRLSLRSR